MATLYISPTGSGTGDGSSPENAGTLADLPAFIAAAGPGGAVLLLADLGPYVLETTPIQIVNGGTQDLPVTISGVDALGNPMAAVIQGSRADPWSAGAATGEEVFRLLEGADNLIFTQLSFQDIGYGAFRVGADIENLTIEQVEAVNVQRFFENNVSGANTSATITGLTLRQITIDGYSRDAIRIQYDSNDILIEDVVGDSQWQDGDNFAVGVHIQGTAHDIILRRVVMRNAQDTVSGSYWNGDGFATERDAYDIVFEDTVATGNTDAGYDIKSGSTTLIRAIAADNGRNFRLFETDTVLEDIVSLDPHYRGGSSSQNHIWLARGAVVTIIDPVLSDNLDTYVFSLQEGSATGNVFGLTLLVGPDAPLARLGPGSTLNTDIIYRGTAAPDDFDGSGAQESLRIFAQGDHAHSLTGGLAADVLRGAAGDDTLSGAAGDDLLIGGEGDDRLQGGAGADIVLGGLGFDRASYEDAGEAVTVSLRGGAASGGAAGDLLDGIEGLIGSAFDDALIGDRSGNDLVGMGGDDALDGGNGDDVLRGGAGADRLLGGTGFDTADYGDSAGAVQIDVAAGIGSGGDAQGDHWNSIEKFVGSLFDDRLAGSEADEWFVGGAGADVLNGNGGQDTADYSGNGEALSIDLDAGNSHGGDAEGDSLAAIETVIGSQFGDTLRGDVTGNAFIGGQGDDALFGGGGEDLLAGEEGADSIDGGDGVDTADYRRSLAGVTVDLAAGTGAGGSGEGDRIANVENVNGSIFADLLIGTSGANRLDGSDGDDVLRGGAGADLLIGGTGIDVADFTGSGGAVLLDLQTGASAGEAAGDVLDGIEVVIGSGFADRLSAGGSVIRLFGEAGDDELAGSSADDLLAGGAGADLLAGGDGRDVADYSASQEGVAVDLASGLGAGGDAAGDRLSGIEILVGTSFDDSLGGDDQDNMFAGGLGADLLGGGLGHDTADYRDSLSAVEISLGGETGIGGTAQGDRLSGIEALIGSAFDDRLFGDALDNVLAGGSGADVLDGREGLDLADYSGSNAAVQINLLTNIHNGGDAAGDSLVGIEGVVGTAFADRLTGDSGANRLSGADGDDRLDGGGGADLLEGGSGDDQYYVDSAGDLIVEEVQGGNDVVRTSLAFYVLGDTLESLFFNGTGDFTGTGNEADNIFTSGDGDDIIHGLGGDDKFLGSKGADTFHGGAGVNAVDYSKARAGLVVNMATNVHANDLAAGDLLYDIQRFSLSAYADDFTGGEEGETVFGRGGADVIRGLAGDDSLEGGEGADTLVGGQGNDSYHVEDSADLVIEEAGEGIDTVRTNLATWTLADNVENLSTSTVSAFVGTGNAADNQLDGNTNNDTLYGLEGNDSLAGRAGADRLHGGEGSDTADYSRSLRAVVVDLTAGSGIGGDAQGDTLESIENVVGSDFADQLIGDAGANRFDGGSGGDVMRGGGGDDFYVIDDWADIVLEEAGAGTDQVLTGLGVGVGVQQQRLNAYVLPDQIESITASGIGQGLRGNGLDNVVVAGSGADYVDLTDGGSDEVTSGAGRDVLYYGSALDGTDSNDAGDEGGDTRGDLIVIQGDYSAGLTLGAEAVVDIEKFRVLKGENTSFGHDGTGLFDYVLTTVDANVAAGGLLVIQGGSLQVGETLTFNGAAELDGRFQIFGGRDTDDITGGSGDDHLLGRAGDDTITGNGGNDRIRGGTGNDLLDGGEGADTFTYAALPNHPTEPYSVAALESTSLDYDTIIGFDFAEDRIDLPQAVSALEQHATGSLSTATFDADLAAALDNILDPNSAVLFTADAGDLAGELFLVVEADGNGAYQANLDFVIHLENSPGGAPVAPDFLV